MKHLLKSYVGSKISVLSAAKTVSGTLMYSCDDYIVVETAPEVIDVVKIDHIIAIEGLKYETFLAAIGRNREAMQSDMLARAGHLEAANR